MNDRRSIGTCAEFDAALTEALADERGASEASLRRLHDHAAGCEACAASVGLIELAGRPAAERDPVPLPDDARWEAIRAGIRGDLGRGDDRSVPTFRSARWRLWAVAASIAAVGWIGWTLHEDGASGLPTSVTPDRAASEDRAAAETPAAPGGPTMPGDTEIEDADPLWAAEDWNDETWAGASPIPDVESLDSDEREALWRWLEDEGALGEAGGGGDA